MEGNHMVQERALSTALTAHYGHDQVCRLSGYCKLFEEGLQVVILVDALAVDELA